jgi:hypothetical protein
VISSPMPFSISPMLLCSTSLFFSPISTMF